MKPSISHFLAALLLLAPFYSLGQIVNIESSRIQSDTVGWAGSGGLGVSIQKNDQQIFTLVGETHVQFKTQKDLWLFLADYSFLKAGDQKFVSNGFAHVRYNRKLNKWLRWEVFAQAQNNLITLIRSRYLFGTGPRFKIMSYDKFRLYAASLMMYEHETERTKPQAKHNDIRNSSYISFTFLPTNNIELISTTFFQPRLGDFGDRRIFNQAALRVKASSRFAMYLKWNYLHDSKPAGNAPRETYLLLTGFDFEF